MADNQPGRRDEPVTPAPGSSSPEEQGYDGAATVGDEGAAAGPEAYQDPFGRPDDEAEPKDGVAPPAG